MRQSTKHSFIPWAKQGFANKIQVLDGLGKDGEHVLPQLDLELQVHADGKLIEGTSIVKNIELHEPGDIAGIESRAIIKTNPRSESLNFEPNFFPSIEFYDEDFPWRYTPFKANGDRLRPWIMLIVLEESEFKRKPAQKDDILPIIEFEDAANLPFPPADQIWAWAHVHADQSAESISDLMPSNQSCSRIICPRKLKPHSHYFAFLIPSFERGRRAGLKYSKVDIDPISIQTSAWGNGQTEFPVYYEWQFSTSENEDFESLVQKIKPQALDPNVGKRWMDIQDGGYGLHYVEQEEEEGTFNWTRPTGEGDQTEVVDTIQKGAILMEGAFRVPHTELPALIDIEKKDENYFNKMASLLNLNEDLKDVNDLSEDHPFYHNPFFKKEIREDETEVTEPLTIYDDPIILPPIYGRWHAQKNTVNKDQEQPDWCNQLNLDPRYRVVAGLGAEVIRRNQEEYMDAAWKQYDQLFEVNDYLRKMQFSLAINQTVYHRRIKKMSSERLLSISGGIQHVIKGGEGVTLTHSIYTKAVPQSLFSPNVEKLVHNNSVFSKRNYSAQSSKTKAKSSRFISASSPNSLHLGIKIPEISRNENVLDINELIKKCCWDKYLRRTPPLKVLNPTLKSLQGLSQYSYQYESDHDKEPFSNLLDTSGLPGDLHTAFFESLFEQYFEYFLMSTIETKDNFSFDETGEQIALQINPNTTIKNKTKTRLENTALIKDRLDPIMAAPDFPEPISLKLNEISFENIVSNLDLIPPNTYGVMETNPAFVEAFMVGLNYEMGRELLWREFPTDQRGTYFQKFWESRDAENDQVDIKQIHTWGTNQLGQNSLSANTEGKLVIVVRADLLMRFSNVIFFLQSAMIDTETGQRVIGDHIIYPSFFYQVDPDINFIGFNITEQEARIGEGYFFMIQERPGELQFGMDVVPDALSDPNKWESLNWEKDFPEFKMGDYINLDTDTPSKPTRETISWDFGGDSEDGLATKGHAATLAWILHQKPVSVAVHISSMLP